MSRSKAQQTVMWLLSILLALAYLSAGGWKLTGGSGEMFTAWGYPAWFAVLIGLLEISGAVGLLIPGLARLAAMGLAAIMLGAAYTHLANGEGMEVVRPLVFLAALGGVYWLRRPNG